jgi:hypothetical protein
MDGPLYISDEQRERMIAADAARKERAEAIRAARATAEAAAKRAALETMLRERFIAAGGTAQEAEAALPGLIADYLKAETLRGESEAERAAYLRYAQG